MAKGRAQKTADQGRAVIEAMRAALGSRPPDYLTALRALDQAPAEWREVATDYFEGNLSAELLDIYRLAQEWNRERPLSYEADKSRPFKNYADRILAVSRGQLENAYRLFSMTLSLKHTNNKPFDMSDVCEAFYWHLGELLHYVPSAPLMELAARAIMGVRLDLTQRTNTDIVEVDIIKVPDELRGQGCFKRLLLFLTEWADLHGLILALTPTNEFGASKTRLTKAYRREGFVSNRTSRQDFRTRCTMIRFPG